MFNHSNPFIRMASYAILGAFLGLIVGLVLGIIIGFITDLTFSGSEGPQDLASFLGMGFGSLIVAILGGFVGLKK